VGGKLPIYLSCANMIGSSGYIHRYGIFSFPEDTSPAKSIGPQMCCHILKSNGRVLQRSTVGRLMSPLN
jgi:hypothetical protein